MEHAHESSQVRFQIFKVRRVTPLVDIGLVRSRLRYSIRRDSALEGRTE